MPYQGKQNSDRLALELIDHESIQKVPFTRAQPTNIHTASNTAISVIRLVPNSA